MDKNQDLEQGTLKFTKKSTEAQMSTVAQGTAGKEITANYNGLFELLLMGVISLAGLYALYKKSSLYLDRASRPRKGILSKLSQPTCASCRFFDRSAAIKCRLHLVEIENQGETNCTDYWHIGRNKFLYR